MLFSFEGKARRNFQHCDEHGDLSPAEILKRMDMSYNASVDFRDLNAQLCGLKQGAFESPRIIMTVWWTLVWPYGSTIKIIFNPEN